MIYQPASIEPGTDQTLHPDLHQQGVLVVDDSAVQRTSAVFCLRKLGLSTLYEAGDGLSAVKIYRGLPRPPAVIVLDLELPGLDGIEVLQRLVEAHQKPHVILVSSADDVLINTVATMAQALGMRQDTPEDVAAQTLAAISRNAADTFLGWPEKLFVRLNALLPRLVDKALSRQARQMRPFLRRRLAAAD